MQTPDFRKFKGLLSGAYAALPGDTFFMTEMRAADVSRLPSTPFRFSGYLAVFCLEGSLDLEINLQPCHADSNTMVLCGPDHVIRFVEKTERGGVEARCIMTGVAPELVAGQRGTGRRFFLEGISLLAPKAVALTGEEIDTLCRYLSLADSVLRMAIPHRERILTPLVLSCFHLIDTVISRRIGHLHEPDTPSSARTKDLFEQFIRLVTEFHVTERGMTFYADKLGLTPKYLSRLVRQVSGRSAPEWIDSFVIMEAKNLLKNTDTTIKEIVWRLHFPSLSVFSKFFKLHTGMSPSDFRYNA